MKSNVYYIKWIGFLIALLGLVSLSYIQATSYDEFHLRHLIQWSAKIAATCFSVAFAISSFNYFFKDKYSLRILKYRSEIGLSFAVAHLYHLCFLIMLQAHFHPVFEKAATYSLMAGGLAYVFLFSMVLTTFPTIKSAVNTKYWILLHSIGGYWIWFIFARSYYKNVVNKNEEYFLFGLLVFTILLRILRALKKKFINN
jgi:hypothetical protein